MKKFDLKNHFYILKNTRKIMKVDTLKALFKGKKIFLCGIIISLFVILLDQITKHSALSLVEDIITKTNGVHTHIKKNMFFNLVLVWNRGISFGIFNGSNSFITTIILLIITSVILYIMYILWKNQNKLQIFCFSLILGGAIGNIIDRFIYGAVIDFIDIHLGNLHWPAFNIADSCICVGVFIYLLDEFLNNRKSKK